MEQKDKELLLKDLCARLPYGVKVKTNNINILKLGTHTRVGEYVTDVIEPCKPYLFPLSSMTEEQKEEYGKCYDIDLANCAKNLCDRLNGKDTINGYPMYNHIDWLNKNHFDYHGLIEKGLAIDASGLNIY